MSAGEAKAAAKKPAKAAPGKSAEALRQKLGKLGLRRDDDLILHLPLRYEDETHLYTFADLPWGSAAQVRPSAHSSA